MQQVIACVVHVELAWVGEAGYLIDQGLLEVRCPPCHRLMLAPTPYPAGYCAAMSQENVEIVRNAFAEFERGNFWVPEVFDPSIRVVWLSPIAGGETETVGLEGMGRTVKEWLQSWEQITTVAERLIDAGDRVVIVAEWLGRGKASGVFTKWRYGAVWTLRDGKVTSIISYTDPTDALEAVGLSEQDAHADS